MPLFEGLSYGGEKNAVVIDIGQAYTKCGFAGENSPRAIINSEVKRPRSGKLVKVYGSEDSKELYDILVDFVHVLYFRHLLVNPKERRVVVVESILTTSVFRDTLAKVLFNHYEVPSVLFAPGHLMAVFTLGVPTGLVMDVGYAETLVLPVFEGIPILKAWQALPLAAKAIHEYLQAQLLETGTVKTGQATNKPLSSVMEKIDEKILEDIKARCCFVTKLSRAETIHAAKQQGETDPSKFPAPPPSVDYPLDGNKILHIEGKIREHTCEVLFEQDNEEKSVATLILDSILQCPVDMRRTLANNIVIMGGTSMLPGFHHRLQTELQALIQKQKYQQELCIQSFKFHKPPSRENFTAWLGGAIFGALEVLANRSVSRESYQQNSVIPDWASLLEAEEKEEKPAAYTAPTTGKTSTTTPTKATTTTATSKPTATTVAAKR